MSTAKSKAKNSVNFEELIRELIDKDKSESVQELRKTIFKQLGLTSDSPFKIDSDDVLSKLCLLAFAPAREAQYVFAEALKNALCPPMHVQVGHNIPDVVMKNKRIFFISTEGRKLLVKLIQSFWRKEITNDFCDLALGVISEDIMELICKTVIIITSPYTLIWLCNSFCESRR
jgi:hypothetical protein